jgi:hypothetical protein
MIQFDEKRLQRLQTARTYSSKQLRSFRDKNIEFIRQYVGKHYGDYGSTEKNALNMLKLALGVYQRQLVSRTPRVLVTTDSVNAKVGAYELELAANDLLDEMDLGSILKEWVKQALFTIGILKVGLEPADVDDWTQNTGRPFVENVLFDDWVWDMGAKTPSQCDFMGNRYRVDLEELRSNQMYNPEVVSKITGGDAATNIGGDVSSNLASGNTPTRDEFYEKVDLWDIWLPKEQLMLTLLDSDESSQPLRVVEWTGPKHGPYHILRFDTVPGNLMPVSPAMTLFDLSDLLNQLFLKVGAQALRQKTVGVVPGLSAADGSAKNIMEAGDGDVVRGSESGLAIQEMKFGGVDQATFALMMQVRELVSYAGGNLDSLGGLQTSASTVGQEEIIKSSSGSLIGEMQGCVLKAVKPVLQDLSHYVYSDPVASRQLIKTIPGTEIAVPVAWGPEQRSNRFGDFRLDVEPYSLQSKGPGERLTMLMQVVSQIMLPGQQMFAQQGINLNLENLLRTIARYSDMPELVDIVDAGGAPISKAPLPMTLYSAPGQVPGQQAGGGGGGYTSTASPSTTRNYVRRSEAQQPGVGQSPIVQQLMQSGQSNAA